MKRALGLSVLLAASSLQIVAVAPEACASANSAALVVDTADDEYRYCVELPDDSVSGIELIELASDQHGLSYRLGYGGEAVCMLAGIGTEGDDCWEKYPDYWGYWRGDSSGGWSWSGSGAGSTEVEPGDVEGWSWGSGQDGSTHPQPPATTYASVCGAVEPEQKPDNPRARHPRAAPDDAAQGPAPNASAAPPESSTATDDRDEAASGRTRGPHRKTRRTETGFKPSPSPSGEDMENTDLDATQTAATTPGEGPPPAGLVGLGAAAMLGGAGIVLARRRKS